MKTRQLATVGKMGNLLHQNEVISSRLAKISAELPGAADELTHVIEKDITLTLPELQSTLNSLKMLLDNNHAHDQETISISVQLLNNLLTQFGNLAQEYECIKKQSGLDGLTGLVANSEALGRFIKLYLKGYKLLKENPAKTTLNYAFMMIDADNFRRGNTQKGHYFMDQVLKAIAQIVHQNIRNTDLAIRLGGEEIGILYQVSHRKVALIKAEMIRQLIEQYNFDEQFKQTVSVGIYFFKINQENVAALDNLFRQCDDEFKRCSVSEQRREINKKKQQAILAYIEPIFQEARVSSDDAVYKAKMLGKNRVETYQAGEDYAAYREQYCRDKESSPLY